MFTITEMIFCIRIFHIFDMVNKQYNTIQAYIPISYWACIYLHLSPRLWDGRMFCFYELVQYIDVGTIFEGEGVRKGNVYIVLLSK